MATQAAAKELVAKFRIALEVCEVPALVRAARSGVGVMVSSKRGQRFCEAQQRSIVQIASMMGLHHCAPECGSWPVQPCDRGHHESLPFWSN
jgi:hypothetical protein